MAPNNLSSPAQLTHETHSYILKSLYEAVSAIVISEEEGLRDIFVRDWFLVVEDRVPIVRIYLDRGAAAPVTLEECLIIHKRLLDTPVFDFFSDEVSIEVGSCGLEPPLRTLEHFNEFLGKKVRIELWQKRDGRARFTLPVLSTRESAQEVVVGNENEEHIVPLSEIRWAEAVYEEKPVRGKKPTKKR